MRSALGATRLDQDVFDAMLLRPSHERRAGEFLPVVGSDRLGVAPKGSGPVQQCGHVLTPNTKACGDVHAFAREVVSHREDLEPFFFAISPKWVMTC